MHLIKETNAVREAGGVHNFVQLFISEVCIWCTEAVSTALYFRVANASSVAFALS